MTGSTTIGRNTPSVTVRHTTTAHQKKSTGSREGRSVTASANRPAAGDRSAPAPGAREARGRPFSCVALPEGTLTAPGAARRGARRAPPHRDGRPERVRGCAVAARAAGAATVGRIGAAAGRREARPAAATPAPRARG